ncbi:MAG: PQQ-binding-like beta-propeller repeat protein [Planctomycetaceae bacterium]
MNQPAIDVEETSSPRIRWARGWIAVAVFVAIAVAAQIRDVLNDRSISNVITMAALGLAYIVLLGMLYRWTAARSSRLRAGLLLLVIIVTPIWLVRLRGFTGEMIPRLEYRFKPAAELQETIAVTKDDTATVVASKPFPQFLGADRNAVIEQRGFAVPASDEEELWRVPIGEGWSGFAIQDQYCVTQEQRDARECVTCYRLADGALLWLREDMARHQNPLGGVGPRSTPTIAGEFVYTQGATGIVQCLRLDSGELVWKQDLLSLGGWSQSESEAAVTWGRATSPLLADRWCIVPFGRPLDREASSETLGGRSLIAFDAASGEVAWTAGDDQISYASPVQMTLGSQPQIVSVNEATVTGHRIVDGKVLWSLAWDGQSNGAPNCSSVVPVGTAAFLIAKGYGTGSAVFDVSRSGDDWTIGERWKSHRVLKTKFTHACVDGEVAYGLSDGTLECVSLTDGTRRWAQGRGTRYGHGQMLRVGDCLVVQAEDGRVAFVKATDDEFRELGSIEALSAKTWNVPAIAGEFLAVRNDTEAVLYRLPIK